MQWSTSAANSRGSPSRLGNGTAAPSESCASWGGARSIGVPKIPGAMASTLAVRMTARERAFALVALIAVGTISATLEPKPVQPPFEITRGERFEGRWTRVGVLPSGALDADAARGLAREIADDSDALIEALDLTAHPPVFVLAQQGMDRHVMQRAALSAATLGLDVPIRTSTTTTTTSAKIAG